MKLKINTVALMSQCFETAIRGGLLNDLPGGMRLSEGDLESLTERIDHRIWCELEQWFRFPEFHEE